jgi:peptide/nickel transport system ATP-binding protein
MMHQCIIIAMALVCKPRLLIADEPTTTLGVTIQGQILDLVKELQAEARIAVLLVTQDMDVVTEIADRIMYHGEAIEAGATADVFSGGTRPSTKALLSAVPTLGHSSALGKPASEK